MGRFIRTWLRCSDIEWLQVRIWHLVSFSDKSLTLWRYGFSTWGKLLRLSLIRAPKAPDPNADIGCHKFRYAIFPHRGGVSEAVVRTARDFNSPMQVSYIRGNEDPLASLVKVVGSSGILLDTVKWVELTESRGDLRLILSIGEVKMIRMWMVKTSLPIDLVDQWFWGYTKAWVAGPALIQKGISYSSSLSNRFIILTWVAAPSPWRGYGRQICWRTI